MFAKSPSRLRVVSGSVALLLVLLGIFAVVLKRLPGPPLHVIPQVALKTHYLLDYEYMVDRNAGTATMGHLVVLNPGKVDARLRVTVYFEHSEPVEFQMVAPANSSTESNYTHWPVEEGTRFALEISSTVPVFCQATCGWNNTDNDYDFGAQTASGERVREVAKSYFSIKSLANRWYVADCYLVDKPGRTWINESEWAILLNPSTEHSSVLMTTYAHGESSEHRIDVPPRRVKWVPLDELVPRNQHYGVRFASTADIAAQWVRTVRWYDSQELMTYWSVPAEPLSSSSANALRSAGD